MAPAETMCPEDTTQTYNHWNYNLSNGLLLNTGAGNGVSYDSTNDCFYAHRQQRPDRGDRKLGRVGNEQSVFRSRQFARRALQVPRLKVSQPDGYDFLSSIRGIDIGKYRLNNSTMSTDKIGDLNFSYQGIYESGLRRTGGGRQIRSCFPITATGMTTATMRPWRSGQRWYPW